MAYLDVTFERSHLLWNANLVMGWDERGFYKEIENLPYMGEWKLRCELRVTGMGQFSGISTFPEDFEACVDTEAISVAISSGKLRLLLNDYKSNLQWSIGNGGSPRAILILGEKHQQ